MMQGEHNHFGKTSKLSIRAEVRDGKTVLTDVDFTAPYKIMKPFPLKNGGIRVMLLAASAGIMDGDRHEFCFDIREGAHVEFVSQSYDKVHPMEKDCAKRHTQIKVAKNAFFAFNPQATIPFRDSAFENCMDIYLEDESAQFRMNEIFTCGRYGYGEEFLYRYYYNLVHIYRGEQLIYRDNTRFIPSEFDMAGMGMYENNRHIDNIFLTCSQSKQTVEMLREILDQSEDVDGGVTKLASGDIAVRIFGRSAQALEKVSEKMMGVTL